MQVPIRSGQVAYGFPGLRLRRMMPVHILESGMHRILAAEEVARILGMSIDRAERFLRKNGLQSRLVSGKPVYLARDILRIVEGMVGSKAADRLRTMDKTASGDYGLDPATPFVCNALSDGGVFEGIPANTKPSLLRHLARLACESGAVYDEKILLELLEDRENSGSTAILDRIAFPHPQGVSGLWLERDLLLMVRTSRPLPFGAPFGRLTSIYFLLLFSDPIMHLHTLARLAGILKKRDMAERLVHAVSAEAMFTMIKNAELDYIARQ